MHSFGFGGGADVQLVKELAKKGKGHYNLISSDEIKEVKTKVIEALSLATKSALTGLKAKWTLSSINC